MQAFEGRKAIDYVPELEGIEGFLSCPLHQSISGSCARARRFNSKFRVRDGRRDNPHRRFPKAESVGLTSPTVTQRC